MQITIKFDESIFSDADELHVDTLGYRLANVLARTIADNFSTADVLIRYDNSAGGAKTIVTVHAQAAILRGTQLIRHNLFSSKRLN